MAVPFLPQTQPVFPGNADLSKQLMLLGDTIGQNIKGYRRQSLLGDVLENGQVDYDKTILSLLQIGDIESAKALATYRNAQQAASGVYGNPIMLQRPDGSYAVGAIGKNGQPTIIDFGPGLSPTVPAKSIEGATGTYVVPGRITGMPDGPKNADPQQRLLQPPPQAPQPKLLPAPPPANDPTMQIRPLPVPTTQVPPPPASGTPNAVVQNRFGGRYYPKDIAGAAAEKERGEAAGRAVAGLPEAVAKADQSITLIDQMIKHPGRETATGVSGALDPRNYLPGTSARDFQVRAKQLTGQAFLAAFESLKGGGHITEIEGQKATEAIARLDRSQSDDEFMQSLKDLRLVLQQGKARAVIKANALKSSPSPRVPQGQPASTPNSSGAVDWKTYFGKQ